MPLRMRGQMPDATRTYAPRDDRFEEEVLSCLPAIARFARSLTRDPASADDLVQETFLLAYRGYGTFRRGEDPLRWMLTICRNAFLRDEERARRFSRLDDADPPAEAVAAARGHMLAVQSGDVELLHRIDIGTAIDRALRDLPKDFRTTVVLVDLEGLSYGEAAAVEAVPIGTIRSRLFRARRHLQERLFAVARDAGLGAPPPEDGGAASASTHNETGNTHAT